MKTGIIIPCNTNEKRLNEMLFLSLVEEKNDYHLCFVTSGSKDNTIAILKEIQFKNPDKVSIIDIKRSSGKSTAIRAGVRYLHSRGDIEFISFIDTDIPDNPKDFNTVLKPWKKNRISNFISEYVMNTSYYSFLKKYNTNIKSKTKPLIYFFGLTFTTCSLAE